MNVISPLLDAAWSQRIGWTLVHSVWQVAVVAAAYALLSRLLRRRSASLRYVLGCVALVAMVAAPAATLVLRSPGPAAEHSTARIRSSTGAGEAETEPGTAGITAPEAVPGPGIDTAAALPSRPWAIGDHSLWTSACEQASVWCERLEPVLPWLSACWLVGVVLLALRPLGGLVVVRRLQTRGLAPLPVELRQLAGRVMARLRVARAVEFAESALVEVPTVAGYLRPIVLLPANVVTGLSADELELVLAHELAHIRRHDYLINLLQTVTEALLFYHPGMWWVSAEVRREREHCCDDVAVAVCGNRAAYIRALWTLESRRPPASAALAATGGSLVQRVRRLAFGRPAASRWERATSWLASVVALGIVSLVILLGRSWADEPTAMAPATESSVAEETSANEPTQAADELPDKSAISAGEPAAPGAVEATLGVSPEDGKPLSLPTLESAPDKPLLSKKIGDELHEIEQRKRGHVIVGRVLVEGDDNPTDVNAQMEILGGGYFAGPVRDLQSPVGFRMHGYAPYDLRLAGRHGKVVDVGTIQMKRLPDAELVPVVGRVDLEGGGDLRTVSVQFSIGHGPVNTPSNGTSPRSHWPEPIQVELDSGGRFYQTGFSPAEYYVSIKAPGYVSRGGPVKFSEGEVLNLGTFLLEKPRRAEIEYIVTRDLPFKLDDVKQAVIHGGERWQIVPDPYRYELEFKQRDGRLKFDTSYAPIELADLGPGELADYLNIGGGVAQLLPNQVPLVSGHVYLLRRSDWKGGEDYALFKIHVDGEPEPAEAPTAIEPAPAPVAEPQAPSEPVRSPAQKNVDVQPMAVVPPSEPPVVNGPPQIDRLDDQGFSQLHRAAMGGHVERVRKLLADGANVNVEQGTYHGTPLQYAAAGGHGETVQVLLDHGAKVDSRDANRRTPLVWAAMNGHADVVRRLLDAGADVNATNDGGWTPLHYAVSRGHVATAQLLIDRGADVRAANSQGKTPVDLNPGLDLRIPWRALERPAESKPVVTPSRDVSPVAPAGKVPAEEPEEPEHKPDDIVAMIEGKPVSWSEISPPPQWYQRRAEQIKKLGETPGYLSSPQQYRLQRLKSLIWTPLIAEYKKEHNLEPTEEEIQEFLEHSREARKRSDQETQANLQRRKQEVEQLRQQLASPGVTPYARSSLEERIAREESHIAGIEKALASGRGPEFERFFAKWYLGNWKLQQSLYKQYGGRAIWQQVGPEALDAMRDFLKEQQAKGKFAILDPALRKQFWDEFTKVGVLIRDPDKAFEHPWSGVERSAPAGGK